MQKKLQLLLSAALCVQLNAQDLQLDTITVTSAAKTEQKLRDVTANTEVITAEEIKEKRYTTVSEALNSLSGISFSNQGGLGKPVSVYVRGLDSERVLVLIDGIRVNDPSYIFGTSFTHLMISDIERIEVIKGAQSGIWGADASAGVINIITKSAQQGFHAGADLEYGNYNTQKHALQLSYKTDNYYLKASSQLFTSDGFSAKVPNGANADNFEADGYKNATTNLKAGYNFSSTDQITLDYTLIDAQSDYDPTDANSSGEKTDFNQFSQVNYKHIDSFNEFQAFAKSSSFDRKYITPTSESIFKAGVKEYGLSSKIPYRNKDFTIITVDYKKFNREDTVEQDYKNTAGAITNSNIFEVKGEELIFVEALRYDEYDHFHDKTTGKLGFKYNSKALQKFSFSTNVGTAYNVPTPSQIAKNIDQNATILKPEETRSLDFGFTYYGFKITYFYNEITDMISYISATKSYENITGNSIIKGVEAAYKDYITDNILLDLSYTYLDAKNEDKQTLKRRPKDAIKYALTYYPTQKLQLGFNGEYIGERFDSDNKQGAQTGYYTLVNFVANYKIDKNFTTYFKIDNIRDTEYQVVDGYATAERSTYLGLSYKY